MPSTFTAAYTSRCGQCDDLIEPGDTAGYIDGEVCCEDCVDEERGFDDLL